MSVRAGDRTVAGTKVSASDVARLLASEHEWLDQITPVVWVVAAAAPDAAECRTFLDVLGIDPAAVAHARHIQTQSVRSPHSGSCRNPSTTPHPGGGIQQSTRPPGTALAAQYTRG